MVCQCSSLVIKLCQVDIDSHNEQLLIDGNSECLLRLSLSLKIIIILDVLNALNPTNSWIVTLIIVFYFHCELCRGDEG